MSFLEGQPLPKIDMIETLGRPMFEALRRWMQTRQLETVWAQADYRQVLFVQDLFENHTPLDIFGDVDKWARASVALRDAMTVARIEMAERLQRPVVPV